MDTKIFEYAKAISEAGEGDTSSIWRAVKAAGYEGYPQALTREMAAALLACWDGKASTLGQAAAWREVWACCRSQDLVDNSGEMSQLGKVLELIQNLRQAAGASPQRGAGEVSVLLEKARLVALADRGYVRDALRNSGHDTNLSVLAKELSIALLQATTTSVNIRLEPGVHISPDMDSASLEKLGEVIRQHERRSVCASGTCSLSQSFVPSKADNDNQPFRNDTEYGGLPGLTEQHAAALNRLRSVVEPGRLDVMRRLLVLQDTCYGLAERAGWWTDLETGEDVRSWPKKHLDNWVSAKLMLTVTEVAEAMEGHRKGLMDDKLPHRPMLEVELADAVIRIMDLAGGLNLDVAGAIVEKLAYNMDRADHKPENRKAAGGKSV